MNEFTSGEELFRGITYLKTPPPPEGVEGPHRAVIIEIANIVSVEAVYDERGVEVLPSFDE